MPFAAIGAAVGVSAGTAALGTAALGAAAIGAISSSNATDAQTQAANQNNALQQEIFQQTTANEKPYLQAGKNSLATLMQGLGLAPGSSGGVKHGSLDAPFTAAMYKESPGYQFQLSQGINAVDNSASATGGVNSGNTLKALTQYGQGLANTDYQQAYNNYVANQNNVFNRLFGVAGAGQNAAASQGGFGQGFANAVSGNNNAIGNANSANSIAQGNNLSNLLSNPNLQSLFQGGGGLNYGAQTINNNAGQAFQAPGVQI